MTSDNGYIVRYLGGGYYRRGQFGADRRTDARDAATVFVNYETAKAIADRLNGVVVRSVSQLSLL